MQQKGQSNQRQNSEIMVSQRNTAYCTSLIDEIFLFTLLSKIHFESEEIDVECWSATPPLLQIDQGTIPRNNYLSRLRIKKELYPTLSCSNILPVLLLDRDVNMSC